VAVDAAARDGVTEQLRKFVPPMFARWEDVTDSIAEVGVYGPGSPAVLAPLLGDAELPADEDAMVEAEHAGARVLVVATRDAGLETGFDCFVDAAAAPALHAALLASATPVGLDELEVLRVEAGRPRYGADLTDGTIPTEAYAEAGLMQRAVSFTKGCYTGQEVIIRIAHRGHVNRHLRGVLLGDAEPPPARTPLLHPESAKEVGWITSAVRSPRLGGTASLGYLRREIAPGDRVRVGTADGAEGVVSGLPFDAVDR
jgi:tRNA-modifying protein YgfZ